MSGMAAEELSQIPMSQALAGTLARASDGARATGAAEITLEHVLAALCDDPDAGDVLAASQIDPASLKAETIAYLARAAGSAAHARQGEVSVSTAVKRILEAAAAAARGGRRRDINGAIVLAAIVGDGRSIAAQMLQARGMTFDGAIRALQSAMAQPSRDNPYSGAPAEDVLARARERVQSRSAPSLRDIMREMPRSAPRSAIPDIEPADIVPGRPTHEAAPPPSEPHPAKAETAPVTISPRRSYTSDAAIMAGAKSDAADAAAGAHDAAVKAVLGREAKVPVSKAPESDVSAAGGPALPDAASHVGAEEPAKPSASVAADLPAPPKPGPAAINPFPPSNASPSPANAVHPEGPAASGPPTGPPPPASPQARPSPPPIVQGHSHVERSTAIKPPPIPPPIPRAPPPTGYAPPPPAPRRPPGIGAAANEPPPRMPGQMPPGAMSHGHLPPGPPLPGLRMPAPGSAPPPQMSPPGRPPQTQGPARHRETPSHQREAPAKAELGQLAENVPRKMRVGISERVEIRIARGRVKAITEGMEGGGLAWRHDVTVTKAMSVRLRAPEGGFFVETASPETQWINSQFADVGDEFASWRFLVTPNTRGWSRLQIIVSARTVGADGLAAETAFPDQVIEVKVKSNLKRAFLRWSGWIAAAVMGGAFAKFGEGAFEAGSQLISKFVH